MVCMVSHSAKEPFQKETALANASLISAAPDLLSALQGLLSIYSRYAPDYGWPEECEVNARAAIAKALGQ